MIFLLTLFLFVVPTIGLAGDCGSGGNTTWSIDQVAALASQKFSCDQLAQAIALAYAESGFRPYCISSEGWLLNYSEDVGLWQMNDMRGNLEFDYGGEPEDQRNPQAHQCGLDPQCNLDYTYRLWEKDGGFTARRWHAYGRENYETELVIATQFLKDHPQYTQSCQVL